MTHRRESSEGSALIIERTSSSVENLVGSRNRSKMIGVRNRASIRTPH